MILTPTHHDCFDLPSIRTWTPLDVEDAYSLTARILKRHNPGVSTFSHELFLAVSLNLAYSGQRYADTMNANRQEVNSVVFFVGDPGWDSTYQTCLWFANYFAYTAQRDTKAAARVLSFVQAIAHLQGKTLDSYVMSSLLSWREALRQYGADMEWEKHG